MLQFLSAVAVLAFFSPVSGGGRVVCYYSSWAVHRGGTASLPASRLDPGLCTHLVYSSAVPSLEAGLAPSDPETDIIQGGYEEFVGVGEPGGPEKLLSVGGWGPSARLLSRLAGDPVKRSLFAAYSVSFLRDHGFTGLDINWQYPLTAKDKKALLLLVKETRLEIEREAKDSGISPLLLTVAVPAHPKFLRESDHIANVTQFVDFVNVLSMDYMTAHDGVTGLPAPLYPLLNDTSGLNIDSTVKAYVSQGVDVDKLVVGVPAYGQTFVLEEADRNGLGAPTVRRGNYGAPIRDTLAYYEICKYVGNRGWTVEHEDSAAAGPFAHFRNVWLGYDDPDIVYKKAEYVNLNKLGGIVFWTLDQDDFNGDCGTKYPLLHAARAGLGLSADTFSSETQLLQGGAETYLPPTRYASSHKGVPLPSVTKPQTSLTPPLQSKPPLFKMIEPEATTIPTTTEDTNYTPFIDKLEPPLPLPEWTIQHTGEPPVFNTQEENTTDTSSTPNSTSGEQWIFHKEPHHHLHQESPYSEQSVSYIFKPALPNQNPDPNLEKPNRNEDITESPSQRNHTQEVPTTTKRPRGTSRWRPEHSSGVLSPGLASDPYRKIQSVSKPFRKKPFTDSQWTTTADPYKKEIFIETEQSQRIPSRRKPIILDIGKPALPFDEHNVPPYSTEKTPEVLPTEADKEHYPMTDGNINSDKPKENTKKDKLDLEDRFQKKPSEINKNPLPSINEKAPSPPLGFDYEDEYLPSPTENQPTPTVKPQEKPIEITSPVTPTQTTQIPEENEVHSGYNVQGTGDVAHSHKTNFLHDEDQLDQPQLIPQGTTVGRERVQDGEVNDPRVVSSLDTALNIVSELKPNPAPEEDQVVPLEAHSLPNSVDTDSRVVASVQNALNVVSSLQQQDNNFPETTGSLSEVVSLVSALDRSKSNNQQSPSRIGPVSGTVTDTLSLVKALHPSSNLTAGLPALNPLMTGGVIPPGLTPIAHHTLVSSTVTNHTVNDTDLSQFGSGIWNISGQRDIVFQDVKIYVTNQFYFNTTPPEPPA